MHNTKVTFKVKSNQTLKKNNIRQIYSENHSPRQPKILINTNEANSSRYYRPVDPSRYKHKIEFLADQSEVLEDTMSTTKRFNKNNFNNLPKIQKQQYN